MDVCNVIGIFLVFLFMEFKDCIKVVCKYVYFSQVQFVQVVGMIQIFIFDLECGKFCVISFVVQIVGVCGVNFLWLVEGCGEMFVECGQVNVGFNVSWFGVVELWDDEMFLDVDEIELFFYKEIELFGGKGSMVILQIGGCKLCFGKYILCKKNIDLVSVVCVMVSGNSMELVLLDGSMVGVDISVWMIKDGDMYVFDYDG